MTEPKIDFSSLDPARDEERWEARIAETVEQAELVRGMDLSSLDPYVGDAGEEKRREVIRRALEGPDALPVVVRLAPKALPVAALLAAAAWVFAWIAPPASVPDADPALALMSWAESGEALTIDQMGVVTGSVSDGR